METYTFYCDPGHSWLKVSKEEIKPIKDQISPYSYMNGGFVYLEEDCDAAVFLIHKFGSIENARNHIKDVHTNNRSQIRNYESYNPTKIQRGLKNADLERT